MKQHWKSILAGTLVGATVLLSACGGSGSNGNNLLHIDNPWWKTEGTLNKNEDGSINFSNIDLRLITVVAGADLQPLRDIVTNFNNENQGKIRITLETVNEENYATNVANRIQFQQNEPDLLMTHSKLQMDLAKKEYIQPLEEIIAATEYEMDWNNYSDVFAKDTNLGYDNATFIVPVDMQSQVVLYNKQMLAELNMGVPTTRDELIEVCEAFQTRYAGETGMNAILMPTEKGHFHKYLYPTAYLQNGGELCNEETYKAAWTSEANTQAFKDANESILSLVDAGYMLLGEEEETEMNRFYNNKGLFLFIPPWRIAPSGGVLESYAKNNGIATGTPDYMNRICERIGGMSTARLFAMDQEKECAEYIYVDSHSFSISTTVKDINKKAACLYFIKWFTENGETAAAWAQAGHNSCNAVALNNSAYTNNIFVESISQNFYDANTIQTLGCNPYAGDLVKHLNGLSPNLLAKPTELNSLIKSAQDKYNGQIEFDEEY